MSDTLATSRIRNIGICTLIFVLMACVAHLFYFYPQLPDQVASHFDAQGNPNDLMDKSTFRMFAIGLYLFIAMVFASLGWITGILPASMVNIPHRDYWLAEERRQATRSTLSGYLMWLAVGTLLFMLTLFHLTVISNLRKQPINGTALAIILGIYLGALAFSILWLLRRFRIPSG